MATTATMRAKDIALDVMRHGRTNEPNDTWEEWRSAIVNGLLKMHNQTVDEFVRGSQPTPEKEETVEDFYSTLNPDLRPWVDDFLTTYSGDWNNEKEYKNFLNKLLVILDAAIGDSFLQKFFSREHTASSRMLDSIVASLKAWPEAGCDVRVAAEVSRIEKAAFEHGLRYKPEEKAKWAVKFTSLSGEHYIAASPDSDTVTIGCKDGAQHDKIDLTRDEVAMLVWSILQKPQVSPAVSTAEEKR